MKERLEVVRKIVAQHKLIVGGFVAGSLALAVVGCKSPVSFRNPFSGSERNTDIAGQATPTPSTASPEPTPTPPLTLEQKANQLLNEKAGLTAQQGTASQRQTQLAQEMCDTAAEIIRQRTGQNQLDQVARLTGQPVPTAENPCAEIESTAIPKPPEPTATHTAIPKPPEPTATHTAIPKPPEVIIYSDLGIRYDRLAGNCDIVNRRTGATVHPALPERIKYFETGVGVTRYVSTVLEPGQTAIIQGFHVDNRGNGVFMVVQATNRRLVVAHDITDGSVAVVDSRDAVVEFCVSLQEAYRHNWARSSVTFPSTWKVN